LAGLDRHGLDRDPQRTVVLDHEPGPDVAAADLRHGGPPPVPPIWSSCTAWRNVVEELQVEKRHQNNILAGTPLLPKVVSGRLPCLPRTSEAGHQCRRFEVPALPAASSFRNFKSKAALEPYTCECPFASEVRVRGCCQGSRTSEAGTRAAWCACGVRPSSRARLGDGRQPGLGGLFRRLALGGAEPGHQPPPPPGRPA